MNRNYESGCFCLIPNLRGKVFGLSPLSVFWVVAFFVHDPSLLRVFIKIECWILSEDFLSFLRGFKKNLGGTLFIFLNWRIIALQNFVVFCHTSTRISYTHVPSLPNLPPISHPAPPSRVSQSPCLGSLGHIAHSHWLYILHMAL